MSLIRDNLIIPMMLVVLAFAALDGTYSTKGSNALTDELKQVTYTSGSLSGSDKPSFNQKANAWLRAGHAFIFAAQ